MHQTCPFSVQLDFECVFPLILRYRSSGEFTSMGTHYINNIEVLMKLAMKGICAA